MTKFYDGSPFGCALREFEQAVEEAARWAAKIEPCRQLLEALLAQNDNTSPFDPVAREGPTEAP